MVAGAAVALLVPALALAGPAAALPSNCSPSGAFTVTCTFATTGSASWTVPSGVSSATFTVDGAAGFTGNSGAAAGGLGGQVSATLTSLSLGQVFTVSVGGVGSYGVGATGGVNGGGNSEGGGGGGGYSSVSLGSTLELLAGGGGGGGGVGLTPGGTFLGGGAGGAGGKSGTDGSPGVSYTDTAITLGGGGGGNAGGDAIKPGQGGAGGMLTITGTCSGASSGAPGESGSADQGGYGFGGGGGGGGGYAGGGGGGEGASDSCVNAEAGQGGGGGGSSYAAVPGATFSTGVQSGDGLVTISYTPLAVTTASLPAATGGRSYTATLAATGGLAPYSWSVPAGTLPPGLRLSAAGVISGIPDVAGTYPFTVTVTDAQTATATKGLSITVSGPVITGLTPDHGLSSGGTLVKITGTGLSCPRHEGFSCRVSVTFGSHRAFVLFASPTAILVIAPPGHGTVQVTVKAGGVSSQATAAGLFTYQRVRLLL